MSKEKVDIGIIGIGRWGKNILRTILELDDVNLSCIATRNKNINTPLSKNCKIYSNWREMIIDSKLDGIIIATPAETHFEIAKNCLLQKINTLVEKPLTLDLSEALFLKKLSLEMNTLLMTEFTQVFNPKFQKMQKSLNLIGNLKFIKTKASNFGPIRENTPVIWDWGSHELSILITLMGSKPEKIELKRTIKEENEKGDVSAWEIECQFKKGIKSLSFISNNFPKARGILLEGQKGIIVLDEFNNFCLEYYKSYKDYENPEKKFSPIAIENKREPLMEAIKSFLDCIKREQKNHWTLELGVDVTFLLDKAYKKFLNEKSL